MAEPSRRAPELLYHYTSASGLIGILTTKTLWATDASFLNDAQEMRYGREQVIAALNAEGQRLIDSEAPELGGPEYSRGTVMRSAADTIRNDTPPDGQLPVSVCVACFCEDGDLLSQWRGYAEASGFAIGFRSDSLESLEYPDRRPGAGPDPTPGPSLVKISYGQTAIDNLVSHVVNEIQPNPTGHPNATGWSRAQDFVGPALARIKHAAFREEHEWRLTVSSASAETLLQFRAGPLGVTPYRPIHFEIGAVAEVVVGPGNDQTLRVRGVQQILHPSSGWDAKVIPSTAPFRG